MDPTGKVLDLTAFVLLPFVVESGALNRLAIDHSRTKCSQCSWSNFSLPHWRTSERSSMESDLIATQSSIFDENLYKWLLLFEY